MTAFARLPFFWVALSSVGALYVSQDDSGTSRLATVHDLPMAEPHSLSNVMNILDGGNEKSDPPKPCAHGNVEAPKGMQAAMNIPSDMVEKDPSDKSTQKTNKEHLEERRKANLKRPEPSQHKKLSDIWKKETPCACPFNLWKPVCGVDGNTYPNECFSDCIDVKVFVHADCKYVKRELWARMQDRFMNGQEPSGYADELCEEGDDDGVDFRQKCTRKTADGEMQEAAPGPPQPYPEGFGPIPPEAMAARNTPIALADTTDLVQQGSSSLSHKLRGTSVQARTENAEVAQDDDAWIGENSEEDDAGSEEPMSAGGFVTASSPTSPPRVETRVFHGQRVPYLVDEIPNPCPQCNLGYDPVCGEDGLTYPSKCFAECMMAAIASSGECQTVQ